MKKRLSLKDQCIESGIDFEEIKIAYDAKPELALLKYYEKQGYIGSFIEGYTILTVLKALMLDKLTQLNPFNDRNDACSRYLEAQFTIHKGLESVIINSIRSINRGKYLSNLREIFKQPFIKSQHPNLSFQCCEALYDAIDLEIFIRVARKFSEDPYTYRNGWPDLIIVKDNEVRFIEVKTTDKLHSSQLITIPTFSKILPYNFSVCKLIKI
ncbi:MULTISPECIES: VRR-NUC domain-containing protein [unclassified Acinetobacter]|uniref:VRR-NUC domain-containing protein n=1 Tax=unclassified Acinetobacter TaxID=196816 RepID=UPI000DCFC32D|nr:MULTISPECIES: VRR-NUC domain-containing protein [unclassified Acinetobacter]MCG2572234.1 VRR-NUC domain-containing protein [Acinetobacter sp. ME22]